MVKEGSLRRCGIGLVAAAGAPETREFNLMRAVLLGGYGTKAGTSAAIADITAAISLDMADKPLDPIHVVTTRQLTAKPGIVFHRATRLPPHEIVMVDGIPTTDPIRTFIDVCGSAPPRGRWLFNRGRRKGLFTPDGVLERIDTESRQGRSGLVIARDIAASAIPGAEKAKSTKEDEVFGWIMGAGFPLPERNVYIPSSFGWDWEIDLLYRHHRIAVEVSPYDTHMDPDIYEKDGTKRNDLERQGYRVIVVTDAMKCSEFLALLGSFLGI
jgi:hypothetical protein